MRSQAKGNFMGIERGLGRARRLSAASGRVVAAIAVCAIALGFAGGAASAATSVTSVTVTNTPATTAAGGLTSYVVGFTTSASGGLSQAAGSEIDITFPSGTGFGTWQGGGVNVGATNVGFCNAPQAATPTKVPCFLFSGKSIAAATAVVVTMNGLNNASPAASYTLNVSTTSDTTQVTSPSYSVTAAQSVSSVTATNTSPTTAAGGTTTYKVGFTTSSTGALAAASRSEIDITFPSGTTFTRWVGGAITVGAATPGYCNAPNAATPLKVQCFVFSNPGSIAANTAATATVNGVTNPTTTGSDTVTISTTSDTTPVTSPSYNVTAVQSVSSVTATNTSPTSAAGGTTTYKVGFTTSSTGALAAASNSEIDITFPSGTTFTRWVGGAITVGAATPGYCNKPNAATPLKVQCFVYSNPGTIAANTAATATVNGVTNPTTTGSDTVTISTTSDTTPATSASYTVTAAKGVTGATATNSTLTTAANGLSTYTIGFTTSSTGALAAASNSEIDITFPSGTVFTNWESGIVNSTAGYCNKPNAATPLLVQCFVYSNPGTIAANTPVTVTLNGVTNPATTGSYKVSVNTTSDPTSVMSPSYTVTASSALKKATIKVSSTLASATNLTYTIGLTTSPTGALSNSVGSSIQLAFPAGTGVAGPYAAGSGVYDGATRIGFCNPPTSGTTVTCLLYSSQSVPASHAITVTLIGVNNPSTSTPRTLKVTTSSDTKAKSVVYCVAAAGVPCISKVAPASGMVGDAVTITGINLKNASAVTFNGTTATITTNTATKITTTVPSGASSGTVSVTNAGGTANSPKAFTVLP
jgi:hypothetical protein